MRVKLNHVQKSAKIMVHHWNFNFSQWSSKPKPPAPILSIIYFYLIITFLTTPRNIKK